MERGFIPSPCVMPQDGNLASCAFTSQHPAKLILDTLLTSSSFSIMVFKVRTVSAIDMQCSICHMILIANKKISVCTLTLTAKRHVINSYNLTSLVYNNLDFFYLKPLKNSPQTTC